MTSRAPPVVIPERSSSSLSDVLFRTPLLLKLIVLDAVINVLSFVGLQYAPPEQVKTITLVSLFGVLVINAGFVAWALGPLKSLEDTAIRVTAGQFDARAEMGPLADSNVHRIGTALNRLLDRVEAERARVRSLASQVVAAGDVERAHLARELHDGAAQSLSALQMLVTATMQHDLPPEARERLGLVLEITTELVQEIRSLSHGIHPRVLDELGLASALEGLVRRAEAATDATITLDVDLASPVPDAVSSALYRVAQEALHNAAKHAEARSVTVRAWSNDGAAGIEVADDGRGFDPDAAAPRGLGLFVMEERVSLLDGTFERQASPGSGVVIRAEVPL